jgi:Protein of unknown function (DUF1638)
LSPRRLPYDPTRVKVIACATVIEEMAPRMPDGMQRQVLEFGLHLHPGQLTEALQAAIDASPDLDAVLLGYGMCSRAIVGLRATHCRLVIPRVDDCIAIFLGSRDAYAQQARGEPGTYYLTKGWIEVGDSPFDEEARLAAKYGPEKANRIIRLMLRNYKRLAFIDTGIADIDRYRERARATADRFDLRFEEIEGSPSLVEKLLYGPWDEECVVVERGDVVRYEAFVRDPNAPTPAMPGFARG